MCNLTTALGKPCLRFDGWYNKWGGNVSQCVDRINPQWRMQRMFCGFNLPVLPTPTVTEMTLKHFSFGIIYLKFWSFCDNPYWRICFKCIKFSVLSFSFTSYHIPRTTNSVRLALVFWMHLTFCNTSERNVSCQRFKMLSDRSIFEIYKV